MGRGEKMHRNGRTIWTAIMGVLILAAISVLPIVGPCNFANQAAIAAAYNFYATTNVNAGDVVVWNSTTAYAVKTIATASSVYVAGVSAETVTSGNDCTIRQDGGRVTLNVTGTVDPAVNPYMVTSTTTGKAQGVSAFQNGIFAIAITSDGTPASGQVYASLNLGFLGYGSGVGGGGSGIENVVEDTTPQLGGDLDVNGNTISGLTKYIPFELRLGIPETNLDVIDFRQGRDSMRMYAKREALSGSDTTSYLYLVFQLPNDFGSFYSGTNIYIDTYTTDKDNGNTLTMTFFDATADADTGVTSASVLPTANTTWQEKTDQITESDYYAGDWVGFRFTVNLDSGDSHLIGQGHLVYTTQ